MVALIASATLVIALIFPGVGFAADPDPADYPASFDFGWFALLASEVGDTETVQTMTDYADAHFEPTWRRFERWRKRST